MTNSNQIILNTAVSYIALLLKMVVGLFVVRFVLQALGEEDYGVYVIVGGIVSMLQILNSNMSNTSMRYLAYSLGSKNKEDVYITFNTTVFIHYLIGIVSIVILEVGGFFMFEYIVNIPPAKIADAKIIYQFMIVTTFISVISVPYDAVTNAHEKIWMLSIFDVISVVMSLALALFLLIYDGDRLIMYGFCLMLIQLIMRIAKVKYAKKRFEECRSIKRKYVDKSRMKEILSFTGWSLLGSLTALLRGQIGSLVLNMFFGVKINAAQGISRQVGTPLNMIVTSMTRAINPQIMKSEGGDDHERMKYIVAIGAKYSSFLFAIFGVPVLIEIPFLLRIWLKDVPEYAVIFCQLTVVAMLMEKFTFQMVHAISAVGRIRNFQIVGVFNNLIIYPIAFILFKNGYPPYTLYILTLFSILLGTLSRFYFGYTVAGINPWTFIKSAVLPVLWPLLISTTLAIGVYVLFSNDWLNLFAVFLVFCISFPILFWVIGMACEERDKWISIMRQTKEKVFKKK